MCVGAILCMHHLHNTNTQYTILCMHHLPSNCPSNCPRAHLLNPFLSVWVQYYVCAIGHCIGIRLADNLAPRRDRTKIPLSPLSLPRISCTLCVSVSIHSMDSTPLSFQLTQNFFSPTCLSCLCQPAHLFISESSKISIKLKMPVHLPDHQHSPLN